MSPIVDFVQLLNLYIYLQAQSSSRLQELKLLHEERIEILKKLSNFQVRSSTRKLAYNAPINLYIFLVFFNVLHSR